MVVVVVVVAAGVAVVIAESVGDNADGRTVVGDHPVWFRCSCLPVVVVVICSRSGNCCSCRDWW